MFKKYPSIENHYQQKHIDFFLEMFPNLKNENFVIQEKCHGCLSKDTVIDTLEYGEKTIGEIVDDEIKCHVKSFDADEKKVVYENVNGYSCKDDNGDWYEIELKNGQKIHITSNHYVFFPSLNCYRKMSELNVGDELLVSR